MDIFDAVQSQQIHRARASADNAGEKAARVEQRIAELETRFNRLALVSHALWELLKDRHCYTEEELRDWVNLTDLKETHPPQNCHKCARVITRAFGRCMYCGEFAQTGDAFDRVH
jgi:hypothetical protein